MRVVFHQLFIGERTLRHERKPHLQLRPLSPISEPQRTEKRHRSGLKRPGMACHKFAKKGGVPEYLREHQLEVHFSEVCKLPQVPKSEENKVPSVLSSRKRLTYLSDCK